MLNENIRIIRKSKGLSQEELAVKLNVVRQTISKWEQGLSVPDSTMLLSISEVLETPVSVLLGESVTETRENELKVISEKLEIVNLQLAMNRESKRKRLQWLLILICVFIIFVSIVLIRFDSPYLNWDYNDPERAVVGVFLHAFEWFFVRISPIVLIGAIVGIVMNRKNEVFI